jgi:ABC-type multidrug transport system ATPase subunit
MIQIKNLSHYFTENNYLFNKLSHSFPQGSKVIIYGENGSGKTTLMKILASLQQPIEGEITLNSLPIYQQKRRITFIPADEQGLFPRLTILENIHYFQHLLKISAADLQQQLNIWSDLIPFQESLHIPFYQCSTGMKKFGLFFILNMHSPQIILLDEFFEGISDDSKTFFTNLFTTHYKVKTIVMTAHHDLSYCLPSFTSLYFKGGILVS